MNPELRSAKSLFQKQSSQVAGRKVKQNQFKLVYEVDELKEP